MKKSELINYGFTPLLRYSLDAPYNNEYSTYTYDKQKKYFIFPPMLHIECFTMGISYFNSNMDHDLYLHFVVRKKGKIFYFDTDEWECGTELYSKKFTVNKSSDIKIVRTIQQIDKLVKSLIEYRKSFTCNSEFKVCIVKKAFLYLIQTEGYTKIGITKTPEVRSNLISTLTPRQSNILRVYPLPLEFYKKAEKSLHSFFKSKRTNGEWFLLDKKDVMFIDSYILILLRAKSFFDVDSKSQEYYNDYLMQMQSFKKLEKDNQGILKAPIYHKNIGAY